MRAATSSVLRFFQVDMQGNVLEPGTTNFGASASGFALHATIYSARPDVKCVMHLNTPNVVAVSPATPLESASAEVTFFCLVL